MLKLFVRVSKKWFYVLHMQTCNNYLHCIDRKYRLWSDTNYTIIVKCYSHRFLNLIFGLGDQQKVHETLFYTINLFSLKPSLHVMRSLPNYILLFY